MLASRHEKDYLNPHFQGQTLSGANADSNKWNRKLEIQDGRRQNQGHV